MRCAYLLLLLASISPAAGAAAQDAPAGEPAPLAEPAPAGDEAQAPDRRRLLKLKDGRVLRARSRLGPQGWELREEGAWRALEGVVARATEERTLLAEARRRADGTERKSAARVELARWMLAEGLADEALLELEGVLAAAPDEPAALALLRSPAWNALAFRFSPTPRGASATRALESLLAEAARGGAAAQELAIARLAATFPRPELERLARLELRRPLPARRSFAARLARRELPDLFVPELSALAVTDEFSDVRSSAALALRSAEPGAALGPLASALEAPWPSVRTRATDALAAVGHPAAVAPLVAHLARLASSSGAPAGVRGHFALTGQIALVTDYDVEIAQAASIGDPIVRPQAFGVVLDARAQAQITREVELRTTVLALERLTGRKERSPEAWSAWWREEGERWLAEVHEARATRR